MNKSVYRIMGSTQIFGSCDPVNGLPNGTSFAN